MVYYAELRCFDQNNAPASDAGAAHSGSLDEHEGSQAAGRPGVRPDQPYSGLLAAKFRNKESTLRRMTDSQTEFAYSHVRDLVNKSIKSNVDEHAAGNPHFGPANKLALAQAHVAEQRNLYGAGTSQASSATGVNPLITQVPHGRDHDRRREDYVEDEVMESPNIRSEDDCDLARFEDFEDEEMGDVGCENVQLKGVRIDRSKQTRAPVAAAGPGHLANQHL